jgi:hypothetical protein
MKLKVTVVDCVAPTVRVVVGNDDGQVTKDVKSGDSIEVEGRSVKIEAGPDNRVLTQDEVDAAAAEVAEREAAAKKLAGATPVPAKK